MVDQDEQTSSGAPRPQKRNWLRPLAYLVVLAAALTGVGYASMRQTPLPLYFEGIAILTGILCIFEGLSGHTDARERRRVWRTQLLHWVTFVVVMNIVLMPSVHMMMSAPAAGLAVLMLLALGSFLAGVHLPSLPIAFLGLSMAIAVPAIAWLKVASLLSMIVSMFVVGAVIAFVTASRNANN